MNLRQGLVIGAAAASMAACDTEEGKKETPDKRPAAEQNLRT